MPFSCRFLHVCLELNYVEVLSLLRTGALKTEKEYRGYTNRPVKRIYLFKFLHGCACPPTGM